MRREKVRLEELRSMAYEEYLHTPEWQETREAALKRAGNRCQVCRAEDVALDVYHTTYETLGCEQESDVIALCAACYNLLSQRQKLTPNDGTAKTAGDEPAYPHFSLSQRALVFTPSALVGVGLPAFLHAPLPAELFGLGAAIALAINSPKLYAEMRDSLPAPLVKFLDGQAAHKRARVKAGEWSKWDRLLGRHLREYAPDQEEADDTLIIDEQDDETDDLRPEEDPAFAHTAESTDVPGVPRLTIEQIVSHIERNSYNIYIGRSMTRPNNPAVRINFYKRHLKLLGRKPARQVQYGYRALRDASCAPTTPITSRSPCLTMRTRPVGCLRTRHISQRYALASGWFACTRTVMSRPSNTWNTSRSSSTTATTT